MNKNLQSGLTLVESLVAITILVVGVLGPLAIAARGIGDGIFARNQLAANYLAQEALEVVINRRYALAREAQYAPPTSGTIFENDAQFSACLGTPANEYCSVKAEAGEILDNCTISSSRYPNCELIYNTTNHLYQKPGTVSGETGPTFTRRVKIKALSDPNMLEVTVTVTWFNKDVEKTLTIVEYIFSQG